MSYETYKFKPQLETAIEKDLERKIGARAASPEALLPEHAETTTTTPPTETTTTTLPTETTPTLERPKEPTPVA